jgi:hypothetical protein
MLFGLVEAKAQIYSAPYYYTNNPNGTVTITGYNGPGATVVIPPSIADQSVTSIGEDAFYLCTNLTSIAIPNSVTTIGDSAFAGCAHLTGATIPEDVVLIGNAAFQQTGLTIAILPDSVTFVGYLAFSRCATLEPV